MTGETKRTIGIFLALFLLILTLFWFARFLHKTTNTISYRFDAHIPAFWRPKTIQSGNLSIALDPNPWNVKSQSGYIKFRVNTEPHYTKRLKLFNTPVINKKNLVITNVLIEADLQNIQLKSQSRYMHGYPEVFIGAKPWGNTNTLPDLFPIQLLKIKRLSSTTQFNIVKSTTDIGVAYTLWLKKFPQITNKVAPDEWEIMIWLYKDGELADFGHLVDTIDVPIKINGKSTTLPFQIRYLDVGWQYLGVVSARNLDGTDITVDIKFILDYLAQNAAKLTQNNQQTSITDYYLMGLELGTKYGTPQDTNLSFKWEINSWTVTINDKELFVVY